MSTKTYLDKVLSRLSGLGPVFEILIHSHIVLDESIEDVRVDISELGCPSIVINPNAMGRWTEFEGLAHLAHAALHQYMSHPARATKDEKLQDISNIAMDLAVNCVMQDIFENKLWLPKDLINDPAWLANMGFCALDSHHPLWGRSYEFYLNELKQNNPLLPTSPQNSPDGINGTADSGQCHGWPNRQSLEPHLGLSGNDDVSTDLIMSENMGLGHANQTKKHWEDKGLFFKGRSFEDMLERLFRSKWREANPEHEQWARVNRRFCATVTDLIIPTEMESEEDSREALNVLLFLDVSGSCQGSLSERFVELVRKIPKKFCNIIGYTFHDIVEPWNIAMNPSMGGGTRFDDIFRHVHNFETEHKRPADAVLVFTDGEGWWEPDTPRKYLPRKASNWFWLLSDSYLTRMIGIHPNAQILFRNMNMVRLKDISNIDI